MKFNKILFVVLLLFSSLYARERINVNFSNMKIEDFVKLISKVTHTNILVNHKINGTVNFVSTTPIYKDEVMGIMVSVLESKGYTLVKNGSIFEVVRSSEAAKKNVAVIKPNEKVNGSIMVTQAITIHDENVDIVAAKVRYLLSKTARLMTMKESNTLLITDYPRNIETIKEVIHYIDLKPQNIVKIIPIEHAEAKKVQRKLQNIMKTLFNPRIVSDKVNIIYDENVNGLILVGTKKNVLKLEKLIKELDVESHVSRGIEIYELKNSDVKSVKKTLTDIIKKQKFSDPSMKPNISFSEEINAIVAIGEPLVLKGIQKIIQSLDKEKYQVYVQAKIIEINRNKSKDLGVKYGFAGGDVSSSGLYAMSANFGSESLTALASNKVLNYLGNIGTDIGSAFALGAAIDFLQTHGASKSISNPSILCVNNKESSIYVGKTISVASGSVASNTGGTGLTTSYKREDVGLTLKIKPRVSSVDKVTLDVSAILETILDDGSKNATGQPVTGKQEVKTQAILRNGESIIIGGLVKNSQRNSQNKVPLLGDIPLVGKYLFSSTSTVTEQDNLVVLLTPHVIDKSEKLSKLQHALGIMAEIQKEYDEKAFKLLQEKKQETKKVTLKSDTPKDRYKKIDIFNAHKRH